MTEPLSPPSAKPVLDALDGFNKSWAAYANSLIKAGEAANELNKQLREKLAQYELAKPIYGFNLGGWWHTPGNHETAAEAKASIKADLGGGYLPGIRVWSPYNGTVSEQFQDTTCKHYMIEIAYGTPLTLVRSSIANAPKGASMALVHEVDNPKKNISPEQFRGYISKCGAEHVASGRTDVKLILILMGGTYDLTRAKTQGYKQPWTWWIPNPLPVGIDAIGGDMYPRENDSAGYILNNAIAASKAMNSPFYIGEFGMGHYAQTDDNRLKYMQDAFKIFETEKMSDGSARFPVVMFYESDNVNPWRVRPRPGGPELGAPKTAALVKSKVLASVS